MNHNTSSRSTHRQDIIDSGDSVRALVYMGDALHRLAKAVEMTLDPEAVQRRRFPQKEE